MTGSPGFWYMYGNNGRTNKKLVNSICSALVPHTEAGVKFVTIKAMIVSASKSMS